MRDRKLLDQTLRAQAAGTLVSPSAESYNHAAAKSRKFLSRSNKTHGYTYDYKSASSEARIAILVSGTAEQIF